jgi:acetylornithine deacetylase/succinyl-diaminopimelate desuccinylase-like protein
LTVKESIRDAHSSLAVIIKNPVWRLIDALKTLRDSSGKILIKDWYSEVMPFNKQDLELLSKEPFDETGFKLEYGISGFVNGKKGIAVKKALAGDPTCNIAGMISGYTLQGAKTVLPASASVKIDFRLVPKMNPKKQISRLKAHLRKHGFSDIDIKVFHGEAASRTDPSNPFVNVVKTAAKESFGSYIVNVSNAGTGPMHSFASVLKVPCISIGSTYMFARIHSPNEFARIDLLRKTTKCMCHILSKF